MDSSQCWALAPWAAMLSQLMQSRDRALLRFQPGACSRGPWETPELQPCTERAGKGAGTSPSPWGHVCHSHCTAALISPAGKVMVVPLSRCLAARLCDHTVLRTTRPAEPLLKSCCWWRRGLSWAGSWSLQVPGLFLPLSRQWEHCWGDGQSSVKPWTGAHLPENDTGLDSPRMCLVHKICLGLCWLNCQIFLGETMP